KEVFNHIVTLEYAGAIESIEQYESFIQHDEDALDAVFSIGESKLGVLVQSKKTPYVCSCLHFTNAQVLIGLEQLKSAIGLWKACKDAGAAIDYCQG
ncbi:hypothetical protein, partial [Proteus mirabilis]|uniref:hypothetical protein n=1 Tax=Proteus mirabilis TaxID=584 RepID=UPI00313AC557